MTKNYITSNKNAIKEGNIIVYKAEEGGETFNNSELLLKKEKDNYSGLETFYRSWENQLGSFFHQYHKDEPEWNYTFGDLNKSFISALLLEDMIKDNISVFEYLVEKYENTMDKNSEESRNILKIINTYSSLTGGYLLYNEKMKKIPLNVTKNEGKVLTNYSFNERFLNDIENRKEGNIITDSFNIKGKEMNSYTFHDKSNSDVEIFYSDFGNKKEDKDQQIVKILIHTLKGTNKEELNNLISIFNKYNISNFEISDKQQQNYQENELKIINSYFENKSKNLVNMSSLEISVFLDILQSFQYLGDKRFTFKENVKEIYSFVLNNNFDLKAKPATLKRLVNLLQANLHVLGYEKIIDLIISFDKNKIKSDSLINGSLLSYILADKKDYKNILIEKYFNNDKVYDEENLEDNMKRIINYIKNNKLDKEFSFDVFKTIATKLNELYKGNTNFQGLEALGIFFEVQEQGQKININISKEIDTFIQNSKGIDYDTLHFLRKYKIPLSEAQFDKIYTDINKTRDYSNKLSLIDSLASLNLPNIQLEFLIREFEHVNYLTGLDSYDNAIYKSGLKNEFMSKELFDKLVKENSTDLTSDTQKKELALLLSEKEHLKYINKNIKEFIKTRFTKGEVIELGGSGHRIVFTIDKVLETLEELDNKKQTTKKNNLI